ncbi:hypothetical protein RHMOL_Rhmol08G0296700 [Rhododendron molle]|uniref:Uncharacterized protein n=1 Tax=Rhododendron molle TaxID=49168 RepID=A0ACC0MVC1_RHOML|nr:hypothetical protein RHMOL_Rhmol08G0296700 [Rhododendron molle]
MALTAYLLLLGFLILHFPNEIHCKPFINLLHCIPNHFTRPNGDPLLNIMGKVHYFPVCFLLPPLSPLFIPWIALLNLG